VQQRPVVDTVSLTLLRQPTHAAREVVRVAVLLLEL
jgi:hypothetical protein